MFVAICIIIITLATPHSMWDLSSLTRESAFPAWLLKCSMIFLLKPGHFGYNEIVDLIQILSFSWVCLRLFQQRGVGCCHLITARSH